MSNNNKQQKTLANMTFSSQDSYIAPRKRLTEQDAIRYREAIRVVILTTNR